MTNITLAPPIVKGLNTVEEPKVGTAIKTIEEYLNLVNPAAGIGGANIIKESITEDRLTAAVQVLLNKAAAGLTLVKQAGSVTGTSGNLYQMETGGATLNLPAPTEGRMVGAFAIGGCKVKAEGAAKIFGDFTTGIAEVALATNQHVTVFANGTNWLIIAGEPKREQIYVSKSWSKAEAETGVTPSVTRPAFVTLTVISEVEKAVNAQLKVGGVTAGEVAAASITGAASKTSLGLWVNPNQVWKLTAGATGLGSILTGTVLL